MLVLKDDLNCTVNLTNTYISYSNLNIVIEILLYQINVTITIFINSSEKFDLQPCVNLKKNHLL